MLVASHLFAIAIEKHQSPLLDQFFGKSRFFCDLLSINYLIVYIPSTLFLFSLFFFFFLFSLSIYFSTILFLSSLFASFTRTLNTCKFCSYWLFTSFLKALQKSLKNFYFSPLLLFPPCTLWSLFYTDWIISNENKKSRDLFFQETFTFLCA